MLQLQGISYTHPNKEVLFSNLDLVINTGGKVALVGNNGSGKSTLLRMIARQLHPSAGQIIADVLPYYLPQIFGQFDHLTIAQALGIERKLAALKEIFKAALKSKSWKRKQAVIHYFSLHVNCRIQDWIL